MPLSRIEIEEYGGGKWLAEVEVGGMVCRRASVRGEGLRALLDAVWAAYVGFRPDEGPAWMSVVQAPAVVGEDVEVDALKEGGADLDDFRRQARGLGIEVDMRWREKTLQGYINMALRR